jgi:hypothetical protein
MLKHFILDRNPFYWKQSCVDKEHNKYYLQKKQSSPTSKTVLQALEALSNVYRASSSATAEGVQKFYNVEKFNTHGMVKKLRQTHVLFGCIAIQPKSIQMKDHSLVG